MRSDGWIISKHWVYRKDDVCRFCGRCGEQHSLPWESSKLCPMGFTPIPASLESTLRGFYQNFVQPRDLVFDIGANLGTRSEVFLSLGCNVIAVEPHPTCVKVLKEKAKSVPNLTVFSAAIGGTPGIAHLITGESHCISSLSQEWIDAVTKSDRFGGYKWTTDNIVGQSTLDNMIVAFGLPRFIKIDVEGYEHEVIKGLSQPIKALSFEFCPEYLESTKKCVKHLESLGKAEFSYSLYESMILSEEWCSGTSLLEKLKQFANNNQVYGDVYARFSL
jgi:FkbM family methyltransferase